MKATGIVRRIDDLGRVVIPKEIRRTMRIREGDPLEIYTDADGEVIFKKYSPIGELGPYTRQYADVLYRTTGFPSVICDRDHVIAAAGVPKKDVLDKRITPEIEEAMEARIGFAAIELRQTLSVCEGLERQAAVLYPIIGAGDIMGAVMVLCGENGVLPGPTESKLVQVAAGFLGKQMEE